MQNKCSLKSCDKDSTNKIIGYSKKNNPIEYCDLHEFYWYFSEHLSAIETKELEEKNYYIGKENPFKYLFYILLHFNMLPKSKGLYLIFIYLIYLLKHIEDIEIVKQFIKARISRENRRIEELYRIRNS